MTEAARYYCKPPDGWVCFHCGDRFTTVGAAEDHLGKRPTARPACRIRAGEERGLVMEIRQLEAQVRSLRLDNIRLRGFRVRDDGISDDWLEYIGKELGNMDIVCGRCGQETTDWTFIQKASGDRIYLHHSCADDVLAYTQQGLPIEVPAPRTR